MSCGRRNGTGLCRGGHLAGGGGQVAVPIRTGTEEGVNSQPDSPASHSAGFAVPPCTRAAPAPANPAFTGAARDRHRPRLPFRRSCPGVGVGGGDCRESLGWMPSNSCTTTTGLDLEVLRREATVLRARLDEIAAEFADGVLTSSQLENDHIQSPVLTGRCRGSDGRQRPRRRPRRPQYRPRTSRPPGGSSAPTGDGP